MDFKYIKPERAHLYRSETDPVDRRSKAWKQRIKSQLLWGDRVHIVKKGTGKRHKVRARGQIGWVDKSKLCLPGRCFVVDLSIQFLYLLIKPRQVITRFDTNLE